MISWGFILETLPTLDFCSLNVCFERLTPIQIKRTCFRKSFTVKDDNKDYESLLIKLSDTKESTDNFFDNVVVNDENHDIKNNRLELLKMFCNTFDNFIDFSKLEGL